MPQIKSLSDFNRNQNAMIEELEKTGEPLYLTRNGSACLVVMDSAAFDKAMSFRDELHEQELRTYRGIMRGYEQCLNGETTSADYVFSRIRANHGWEDE